MKKQIFSTMLAAMALVSSASASADGVPRYATTVLPNLDEFPDKLTVDEYQALLSIQVHQDTLDDNKYYYTPLFRAIE